MPLKGLFKKGDSSKSVLEHKLHLVSVDCRLPQLTLRLHTEPDQPGAGVRPQRLQAGRAAIGRLFNVQSVSENKVNSVDEPVRGSAQRQE